MDNSTEFTKEEKKEFYKRFSDLDRRLDRILSILESDDKTKEKGVVETLRIVVKDVSELLTREKIYKSKATTWGVVGGAVGTAFLWGFKYLIAKIII